MPIPDGPPRYQVFLLRCWEERGEHPESGAWRFSLQDPATGLRRGFASLEALVAALEWEMEGTNSLQRDDP